MLDIATMGPGALLGLSILLILTRRFVWYTDVAAIQKRNAVLEATNRDLAAQNRALLESLIPPVRSVFSALHEAAGGDEP